MAILKEEGAAQHLTAQSFIKIFEGAGANSQPFIQLTYGHPLAQDLSSAERRSQQSTIASQVPQSSDEPALSPGNGCF